MAKTPATFADWKSWLGNSTEGVMLKGLTPAEQQAAFKAYQNELKTHPDPSEASMRAVQQMHDFNKSPTPQNVPAAVASTPDAKANVAGAQADANAAKGSAAASAQQRLSSLIASGGAGSWYPWMTQSSVDANGNEIGVYGPDSSSKQLTDDKQTQFRQAWNDSHPDQQYSDNLLFMQSSAVVEGRSDAVAAFQKAFKVGPNNQTTYTIPGTYTPGQGPVSVSANTGDIENARDAMHGGAPALDQYMSQIIGYAADNNIPWQVLWGVLRARLSASPNQQSGVGIFNLDPGSVPHNRGGLSAEAQIAYLARQLKAGFDQTGDWAFAALYTDNPTSAMQLFHTGRSSDGRAYKDGQYVSQVFGNDGTSVGNPGVSLYKIGFNQTGQAQSARQELITKQMGGFGSGTGAAGRTTITLPDMNVLQQQADDMIRKYLFRAPNPGEAEAMAGQMRDAIIQSQQSAVAPGVTPEQQIKGGVAPSTIKQKAVDPAAGMLANIEGTPEYQGLYSHRGGLTQAEYAGRFQNVESSMLGTPNADPTALRQGMQAGDSADQFAGTLFGSEQQNSTFRQRLYQLGQAVAKV